MGMVFHAQKLHFSKSRFSETPQEKYDRVIFLQPKSRKNRFTNKIIMPNNGESPIQNYFYTPDIYADGYIVFAFPFVCSSVRMFVVSLVQLKCQSFG